MANTYVLIASNTLGSSAASVTFSSIPGTYTDLVLRVSARDSDTSSTFQDLVVNLNSNATGITSYTQIQGSGAAASSAIATGLFSVVTRDVVPASGTLGTSNTFGSIELYFPNYTGTSNKPISSFGASERNNSTAYITTNASLFRNTSAITSIAINASGTSFVSGSSFWLYGISKN